MEAEPGAHSKAATGSPPNGGRAWCSQQSSRGEPPTEAEPGAHSKAAAGHHYYHPLPGLLLPSNWPGHTQARTQDALGEMQRWGRQEQGPAPTTPTRSPRPYSPARRFFPSSFRITERSRPLSMMYVQSDLSPCLRETQRPCSPAPPASASTPSFPMPDRLRMEKKKTQASHYLIFVLENIFFILKYLC